METEPLTPVADRRRPNSGKKKAIKPKPKGRPADLIACALASLAAILAAIGSLLFFLGFAANDSVLAGLVSAFAFSVLLGAFAVVPALVIALIAWRGWKSGLRRKDAIWVIILCTPWVVLSSLAVLKTPLPIGLSFGAFFLSGLLLVWAVTSFILGIGRNFGPK